MVLDTVIAGKHALLLVFVRRMCPDCIFVLIPSCNDLCPLEIENGVPQNRQCNPQTYHRRDPDWYFLHDFCSW